MYLVVDSVLWNIVASIIYDVGKCIFEQFKYKGGDIKKNEIVNYVKEEVY